MQWAYDIGVPAKSGVGGCVFMVVPNVGGFSVWSPRLDGNGNSVRGVAVATALVKQLAIHNFEVFSGLSRKKVPTSLPHVTTKKTPASLPHCTPSLHSLTALTQCTPSLQVDVTMKKNAAAVAELSAVLFAAAEGDAAALEGLHTAGTDITLISDYDQVRDSGHSLHHALIAPTATR